MRLLLILFTVLFSVSSYGEIIMNDSVNKKIDSIINFKQELKKFKDSTSFKKYPNIFSKEYSRLSEELILDNTNNLNTLFRLSQRNSSNTVKPYDLNTSGSISRGITVGNNQNSVLNSELDLQISGMLSESVSIKASIQDSNVPLQENGYSQQLDEFDQIFIELASTNWKIRGGDIDLSKKSSFFGNFDKRIQGLLINSKLSESIEIKAAGAIVKGKYKKSQIYPQNGNQGPYKLIGESGELYVLVVSGSESVFVNGVKIERGKDKDYVINYNAGEIIFNTKFPIMADMRIQVDYQVSEKNYNSFVGFSNIIIKKNKFTHNISYYNENDLKNQPLLQNLSDDQKEILTSAGDDNQLMNAPTGIISSYDENRILYKKETINNIEIYTYSNDPDEILYNVNFSNVGDNLGDYLLLTNNTIDNIYEYISPINGVKQGNYSPEIQLIAPQRLELMVYNTAYRSEKNSTVNFELAASNKDKNLFSSIDDTDNTGFASKFNYSFEKETNKKFMLNSEINIDYIDKNFQPIERIYNTEFNRDWSIDNILDRNKNQLLSDISIGLKSYRFGNFDYQIENLELGNNYKGTRNNLVITLDKIDGLKIFSNSSLMNSETDNYKTEFIRSNNNLDYKYNIGWSEIKINLEKKVSDNPINNIINTDFAQKYIEIKNGFGDREKSFIEFGYRKKINDSVVTNDLENVNYSDSYFIDTQILNKSKSKLNIYINQNKLVSKTENRSDNFLNTRMIYNQKVLKNIINSNLFFETNSGNLPQQEYTFLEVEPGLGSYKWIDVNQNNIQELEEFEVAIFEDEGKYIRVLLPNQIFIKTYQNKLNYSLGLNFSRFKNSKNKFEQFISKISNQFQYSIDKKSDLNLNSNIDINPFQINKDELLAYNYSIKNILYLNKGKQKHSVIFTYSENESKNNFTFGSTRNAQNFKRLNIIHKAKEVYLFELMANKENKSSWSENYLEKNYLLEKEQINPKLTYLAGKNNRINFLYQFSKINNRLGNQEFLNQQQFGISLFLNQKQKRGFVTEFNYFKNEFNGDINSIISYVMMNGLQNGENYTWSIRFQQKISKLLDLNFIYYGRKSENSRTIHNGSVQLKAIF